MQTSYRQTLPLPPQDLQWLVEQRNSCLLGDLQLSFNTEMSLPMILPPTDQNQLRTPRLQCKHLSAHEDLPSHFHALHLQSQLTVDRSANLRQTRSLIWILKSQRSLMCLKKRSRSRSQKEGFLARKR